MEGNTSHSHVKVLACLKDWRPLIFFGTKLATHWISGVSIVDGDSQDELSLWIDAVDLLCLFFAVKGHNLDSSLFGIGDMSHGFAWVSVQNVLGFDAQSNGSCDLSLGGAVELGSHGKHCLDEFGVTVGLE